MNLRKYVDVMSVQIHAHSEYCILYLVVLETLCGM